MNQTTPKCLNCGAPLSRVNQKQGFYWECDKCMGVLISVGILRDFIDNDHVDWFWGMARKEADKGNRKCPFCRRRMVSAASGPGQGDPDLDICRYCTFVWFDPGEFEKVRSLPKITGENRKKLFQYKAPPSGVVFVDSKVKDEDSRRGFARKLQRIRILSRPDTPEYPETWWQIFPGLLGFPVPLTEQKTEKPPIITVTAFLLVCIISVYGFHHIEEMVERWGMIPNQIGRYWGLSLLTSFFIHGGWMHLIGNMYFFLTFGADAEDYLGRIEYVLLLILGSAVGNLFHWYYFQNSGIPCIGASCGVAAVMTFYVIKFPRHKFGYLLWFLLREKWLKMPAWVFFAIWIFFQGLGVMHQLGGRTNVSALGHVGGAFIGAVFGFVFWRKKKKKEKIVNVHARSVDL